MAQIVLNVPDGVLPDRYVTEIQAFFQCMLNRLYVGRLRYGPAVRRQKYATRAGRELSMYRLTGNFEQLLNVANYAFLESQAPQNSRFHFDPEAASATREAMGGNIA